MAARRRWLSLEALHWFALLRLKAERGYFFPVSTLVEIEEAIAKLPAGEFQVLLTRLKVRDGEAWDGQIEADAQNGQLDALYTRLTSEDGAETRVSLDEVLDDAKLS